MAYRIPQILAALALLASQAGAAMPHDPAAQARAFATCLGRYSAVMEHGWLIGGDSSVAATRRETFEDLLNAILPVARDHGFAGSQVWQYRLGAKQAQARLLQMAYFNSDPARATRARTLAMRQVRTCDMLIG